MDRNVKVGSSFHSYGDDTRVLQYLKSARPIAEKSPGLGKVVELIDEAILEAESRLKVTGSNDRRKH